MVFNEALVELVIVFRLGVDCDVVFLRFVPFVTRGEFVVEKWRRVPLVGVVIGPGRVVGSRDEWRKIGQVDWCRYRDVWSGRVC